MIRVELVRAWPRRHESTVVEMDEGASASDALAASGWSLDADFVGLAIFGQTATASTPLRDGDRLELLRGLQLDPKQARRLRAARATSTSRSGRRASGDCGSATSSAHSAVVSRPGSLPK